MSDEKVVNEATEPGVEEFVTTASNDANARSITLAYDFGASLESSTEKFGAEVVHGAFVKAAKIALQAYIRRLMNAEKPATDDEIRTKVSTEWKLGARQPRVSGGSIEALSAKLAKLSPEKKKELLEKLMAEM